MTGPWPNLFLAGAAKAGTTSLHSYLAGHPRIFMSPVKEPHFFSRLQPSTRRRPFLPTIDDEGAYLSLFRVAGDSPFRGESSTSYLTVEGAAERIRERCPDARVVVSLREPVSRAYSHYLADRRDGVEDRSFAAAIEDELGGGESPAWGVGGLYVRIGRYQRDLIRMRSAFGPALRVVFFENLIDDPAATVAGILDFLELDATYADSIVPEVHNPHREPRRGPAGRVFASPTARRVSRRLLPRNARARLKESLTRVRPKPRLDRSDRERLADLYRPEVEQLAELLGERPPWPAFGSARTQR